MTDFPNTPDLPESLLESLREKNPFISGMAAEPWFNNSPDIDTINQQAFKGILNLIKSKAAHPRTPLAGTVLGEAGEGKTHLLRRILLDCKKLESPSLFVFVRPLFDSTRPFNHLLREIVQSLTQKSDGQESFCQFDRLVAEIMRDYIHHRVTTENPTPGNKKFLEQLKDDVFLIFTYKGLNPDAIKIVEREAVNYVHSQVPETSREFLKVVFQYKDPAKQSLVVYWLKGNVPDEEDNQLLGVPSRAGYSIETMEQKAHEMILTLGVLFTRYHIPMVVCFDQLDNLTNREQIVGFGQMIDLLVNHAASMLPLAFARGDAWNEQFQQHLSKPTFERLNSNRLPLFGCTKEEAKELVSRRVEEQVLGEKTEDIAAIKNWLLPLLEKRLQISGTNSPREVIRYANEIIQGISGAAPAELSESEIIEKIAEEYKAAFGAVAADFDRWEPEAEYLQQAAELFLYCQENVLSCMPGGDRLMAWTGTLNGPNSSEIPYACFINKSKHHRPVLDALDRCKEFLQKYPNGVCSYITDARCDFRTTWTKTNERRKEVEKLGGNVVILDQPAAVRWYGLASLSLEIGDGNIRLGTRLAAHKDLENFLRSGFFGYKTEGLFDRLIEKNVPPPPPPPPPPPVEKFINAVQYYVEQSPLYHMPLDFLIEKLREKGFDVTPEWCLEQIGKNQNKVKHLRSKDGYIVKLV